MSEAQFSRLDWRPSRKRATQGRLRAYGGQKQAPVAFLAVAPFVGFGKGPQKRCRYCRRFAFKAGPSAGFCRWHAGLRLGPEALRRKAIAP